MIFQHTWQKVLNGQKTQTARLVRPGHEFRYFGRELVAVYCGPRRVYGLGQSRAVQPGRGIKSVGRIHIVHLRRDDVRLYSLADAINEGFADEVAFWAVWCGMHDPEVTVDQRSVSGARAVLLRRPDKFYDGIVINFFKGGGT